jgi:hypothetical protein
MGWDQLNAGVVLPVDPRIQIPELHEVALDVVDPDAIADLEAATHRAVVEALLAR